MQVIPLIATPSQSLSISLNNQSCQINVYQKSTGIFVDLFVNNALIIGGVLALNAVRIVRDAYLGFVGDLVFFDTQGATNPVYTGLGGQYQFSYLEITDLANLVVI